MIEPGGRGGVTDYTDLLTAALVAEGGRQVVLVTARDHRYPERPGRSVRRRFAYVRRGAALRDALRATGMSRVVNGLTYLGAHLRCIPDVRRAGVVHVQGFENAPLTGLALLILRAARRPIVHTPHNTFSRGGGGGVARRLMFAIPDRVVVHTEADRAALPQEIGSRTVVIPHGDYEALATRAPVMDPAAARRRLGLDADAVVALVFGQLRPDKGIDDLVEAAAVVPGAQVLLAGEDLGGVPSGDLPPGVVVRNGFQDDADMACAFAAADVTVLAYRQASMSGVLLLSYAFATPVVIYPAGGLSEAVADGQTGWICARPDSASLADALRAVRAAGREECARRGAAGRALARERFGWPAIARRTSAVYEDVAP